MLVALHEKAGVYCVGEWVGRKRYIKEVLTPKPSLLNREIGHKFIFLFQLLIKRI